MKIIILFFFLVISFSGYSKHLDEGKVVNCKVIEHAAQSFDEFDDRVYSNNKSFQFRIKYIDDEGGILELSDKGKELFNEDFFRFKFDPFHNDSYTNQEEAEEIRGSTDIGSVFSFEDNNFVHAFAHAKLQTVEYLFASCDSF